MVVPSKRRVAVVGGGGFRTPRLLYGLFRHAAVLGLETVVLYDQDEARARVMARLGAALGEAMPEGPSLNIELATELDEAVRGASWVLLTIRPGGEAARVADEQVSLRCGVLGQETVGPGGFFLALRTLPVISRLVSSIRAVNPQAWIINFSNPVGIVSEAMATAGERRFIGVCDTPHHLKQELARFLNVEPDALRVETVGLNHLGWFLALWQGERDWLPYLLEHWSQLAARVRPLSFFTDTEIDAAGALPTEYVYLYQHAEDAARRIKIDATRGIQVARRSAAFFQEAETLTGCASGAALLDRYLVSLAGRSNSYFQAETGTAVLRGLTPETILATESYERVAIDTMQGLVGRLHGQPVLNVPHSGAAGFLLPDQAVMELACRVDPSGPVAIPITRPATASMRSLIQALKRYEVATAAAARASSEEAAIAALALNPVVGNRDLAASLVRQRGIPPREAWTDASVSFNLP